MTAEALTTEHQIARVIDPEAWRTPEQFEEYPAANKRRTDRQAETLVKASTILALIEGAQGKDGGSAKVNWRLAVAIRRIEDLGAEMAQVIAAVKSDTSPPQVVPQAGGERTRTAGTVEVCEDCPPIGYSTDKTRCLPCPRRVPDGTHPKCTYCGASGDARCPYGDEIMPLCPRNRPISAGKATS